LIQQDGVAVVFGYWTSASRKAVLPVFEELNGLLFYPVQYEGLKSSPNIYFLHRQRFYRSLLSLWTHCPVL
jgi:urea transport system substrate-binding protein